MNNLPGSPSRRRWLQWVDLRGKNAGSWGFLVNRLAGLGLTLYLFLHLFVLGKLAKGPEAYDGFVKLAHHPAIIAGEVLVVLAVLLHGFNGIRILLTSFGVETGRQRLWLYVAVAIAIFSGLYFSMRMAGVL